MSEKKPSEMTPAERQEWAMRTMPLSDDPVPASTAASGTVSKPVGPKMNQGFEPMPDMPDSPYVVIIAGYLVVLVAGFGAGLLASSDAGSSPFPLAILAAVAIAGSIAVSVGTIGAGVRFGMRHSRWEGERERRIEASRRR